MGGVRILIVGGEIMNDENESLTQETVEVDVEMNFKLDIYFDLDSTMPSNDKRSKKPCLNKPIVPHNK